MFLFAEMPVLMLPVAVVSVITIGRIFTVLVERLNHSSNDTDLSGRKVSHA
ncbi:MAG: hypothetical protein VXW65_00990 [Pseudomonadota bacterium]|nr:hypothetical protein [Pseudomonadota bacterium]